MNSIVQGHVNALVRHIAHFEKDSKLQINREFITENKPWNPVHLFTKIIEVAEVSVPISKKDLESLVIQFNQENNTALTLDWFYQRHWIRVIFNIVKLPPAVSYAVHSFDEIKENLQELRFLLWIINQKGSKINEGDFKAAFQSYQEENEVALDLNAAYFKKYVSKNNEVLEISHPSYFEQFLQCETEFRFLSFLKEYLKDGNHPVIRINTTDLQRIISEHTLDYKTGLSYDDFVKKGIFIAGDRKTSLYLNDYWHYFGSEILSAIWVKTQSNEHADFTKWLHVLFSQPWIFSSELFIPKGDKEKLLGLLHDLLEDQQDFEPLSEEINKARLDNDRDLMRLNHGSFHESDYEISLDDTYYERSYQSDMIAHESNSNLLMIQQTRQDAFRLIRLIIVNDGFYNETNFYFTKKLIESGKAKPFLLYAACEVILNNRYDVIPYLLAEPKFSCLGLYLLSQVEAPTSLTAFHSDEIQEKAEHLTYLWDAGFEIFFKGLSSELAKPSTDFESVSEIIAEYLTLVCRLRYSGNRDWKYNQLFRQSDNQMIQTEQVGNMIISVGYYPKILPAVFKKIVSSRKLRLKGRVTAIALDQIHTWFTVLKWIEKVASSNPDLKLMLKAGLAQLSEFVNSHFNDNLYDTTPSTIWGQQKNLELLPWYEIAELYNRSKSLHQLLVIPTMQIEAVESKRSLRVNQKNSYQINRTRTYLLIASKILRGLKNRPNERELISKVEEFYLNLLEEYSLDNISEGKINILHQSFDSNYGYGIPRLLPEVIHDLNSFHNVDLRKRIISRLAERLAFQQVVEIRHYLTSDGDKELLKSVIVKRGLDSLFEESRWIPDFDTTLRILAWENVLSDELDTFIAKLDNKKSGGLLFHLKLYQSYHKADLKGIRDLRIPEETENGFTKDDFKREKKLFEAILLMKDKQFDNAFNILSSLSYVKKRFVYSLNQFICLISKAEQELLPINKRKFFEEAVQFWDEELKQFRGESDISLQATSKYYQMVAYHTLEMHNELDTVYNSLALPEVMNSDFLLLRVKNLVARSRESEANELYRDATDYHTTFGLEPPKVLEEISELLTSPAQLNRLSSYYQQILSLGADEIIRIVPKNINPNNQSLIDFISYELEYCLMELIKRVRSLSETSKETKYNDLLATVLQARIAMYNWVVKDNSTGNRSGSGTNAGERDIIIARNHIDICVIECLHVSNNTTQVIQKHIAKVFSYSESKMPKFIVGYYKGETKDFRNEWNRYKETIFPATKFEDTYKPEKAVINEIATTSDGLLKGKSYHGDGHELIHIFVNLNLTA